MDFGKWPSCWKSSKISSRHKLQDRLICWGFPIPSVKPIMLNLNIKTTVFLKKPVFQEKDSKAACILALNPSLCQSAPMFHSHIPPLLTYRACSLLT